MIQLLLDKPLRCAPDNSGIVNDTGVALEIADSCLLYTSKPGIRRPLRCVRS